MIITSDNQIKTQFNEFLKACQSEPVVVTIKGKAAAVLLSVNNEEELENLILTHSLRFQEILDRGKEQILEGKSIGHEEFWNEMEENT
ncbi:MAG: hypothetical protein BWK80_39150 [Desulfobacteraceae bacterium IS3]|nr:MAG: hypothetical protein BWK80_39150 [Desulfobacteraceae bacterium IS3]